MRARRLDRGHRGRHPSPHREVPARHEVAVVAEGLRHLRGPLGRAGAQAGGGRAAPLAPARLGQGRTRGPLPAQERERQDGAVRHGGRRPGLGARQAAHVQARQEAAAEGVDL